ncbi:unnamed protein product [Cuscuta europaea]|uniref:Uncharacterized protein n=1 Tax=Cuscuta europaea TaxID=41803 RepID=A0A9P1E931_CUSEU|nr:unnamed protein product [Cuscuta europaea]
MISGFGLDFSSSGYCKATCLCHLAVADRGCWGLRGVRRLGEEHGLIAVRFLQLGSFSFHRFCRDSLLNLVGVWVVSYSPAMSSFSRPLVLGKLTVAATRWKTG